MKTNVQAKIHQTNHRGEDEDSEFDEIDSDSNEEEMDFLGNDEEQDDIPKPKVFKLNDSSNTPLPVVSKQDRKLLKIRTSSNVVRNIEKTRCQSNNNLLSLKRKMRKTLPTTSNYKDC